MKDFAPQSVSQFNDVRVWLRSQNVNDIILSDRNMYVIGNSTLSVTKITREIKRNYPYLIVEKNQNPNHFIVRPLTEEMMEDLSAVREQQRLHRKEVEAIKKGKGKKTPFQKKYKY